MATVKQNEEFTKSIMIGYPLDEAIEYIKKNFDPEDVFDEHQLLTWAENNGHIEKP